MEKYGANQIETLQFRDAIRTKISMYLGSADNSGIVQCIREIVSNSIDEFTMGYGKRIILELHPNNMIRCIDNGRGIPFGERADGTEAMEAVFTTAHSGGKFNDKTYQSVIGMNGIGAKGVALSSASFRAVSFRDGKRAELILEKGVKKSFTLELSKEKTGTMVEFIPDSEVFHLEPISIDFEIIKELCQNWSYLTKGLTFELVDYTDEKNKNKKIIFCAQNGILDLLKDTVKSPVHTTPFYCELKEGDIQIEIAAQWTKNSEKCFVFTNGLHNTEGGTSLTGLKTSITRNINKILGKSFTGEMARSGMVYIVSVKIPNPSFANQTKTKINNPELRQLCDKAFSDGIAIYKEKYAQDMKAINEFLSKEEKAELAAEKARSAVLMSQKIIQTELKKKSVLAGKLTDCRSHGADSQLLIVEGKSAAGGISRVRDSDTTAIYPLRGKLINVLKNDLEDVMKNQEIQELNIALGCGFQENYNSKKMRYGRVVIMADADVDGYSIMCLVLTFFYKFYPELIREGRLYWGKTPLFKVKAKDKTYYAYDDEELKKLPQGDIIRLKGLGESEPEDFKNTIFSENGKYVQFTMEDTEEAFKYFEMLLGDEIEQRRDYIFNNVNFEETDD